MNSRVILLAVMCLHSAADISVFRFAAVCLR